MNYNKLESLKWDKINNERELIKVKDENIKEFIKELKDEIKDGMSKEEVFDLVKHTAKVVKELEREY